MITEIGGLSAPDRPPTSSAPKGSRPTFGEAVRARRAELHLSQERLAAKAGVSVTAVSRVERGAMSPSLRIAAQIAVGLGVPLADLVGSE